MWSEISVGQWKRHKSPTSVSPICIYEIIQRTSEELISKGLWLNHPFSQFSPPKVRFSVKLKIYCILMRETVLLLSKVLELYQEGLPFIFIFPQRECVSFPLFRYLRLQAILITFSHHYIVITLLCFRISDGCFLHECQRNSHNVAEFSPFRSFIVTFVNLVPRKPWSDDWSRNGDGHAGTMLSEAPCRDILNICGGRWPPSICFDSPTRMGSGCSWWMLRALITSSWW